MIKTDTKSRPAESFDILIVPRGASRIKRLALSFRSLRIALACAALVCTVFVGSLAALVYYRHAYLSTQDIRVKAADFAIDKAALLDRLAKVEDTLSRAERFTAKIESAVDKKPEVAGGKGPVEEEDSMPAPSALSQTSAGLGAGTWRSPFAKTLSKDLKLALDKLDARAGNLENQIHSVFAKQEEKRFFWASLPSIWPTKGWVTSEFGDRRGWGGRGRLHDGIDIAGPRGTPIIASGDGVVTNSGYRHGYGQTVTLDHGYGISTLYGHCSALYVTEGQRVKRGMVIALVGNTGSSTGPHLHYEVHVDGAAVNPLLYIMR